MQDFICNVNDHVEMSFGDIQIHFHFLNAEMARVVEIFTQRGIDNR